MRKLLLTSSALVAAASISSYAVADVSVTGEFEWKYIQKAADLTSVDGDDFATDNEIVISFSNKTDSGLTIGGKMEMGNYNTDDGTTTIDESVLTISGGFGTFRLGNEDSIHETFGVTEVDLIDEEGDGRVANNTISANAGEQGSTDTNKIAYITPSMGGFKAGMSVEDSGTGTAATDMTAMGASYTMPLASGSLLVEYNQSTRDGTTDTDTTNMGATYTMGAMSIIVASMTKEQGTTNDEEGTGFGIKYDMGGGLTIAASSSEVEDTGTTSGGENEKYTSNIGEVVYTVAPGLKAKVTYTDYEYKDGGGAAGDDDSGQITQLTISAAF
ncbi:MAG: porin [Candidatus Puniceispirillales bacterium]